MTSDYIRVPPVEPHVLDRINIRSMQTISKVWPVLQTTIESKIHGCYHCIHAIESNIHTTLISVVQSLQFAAVVLLPIKVCICNIILRKIHAMFLNGVN